MHRSSIGPKCPDTCHWGSSNSPTRLICSTGGHSKMFKGVRRLDRGHSRHNDKRHLLLPSACAQHPPLKFMVHDSLDHFLFVFFIESEKNNMKKFNPDPVEPSLTT